MLWYCYECGISRIFVLVSAVCRIVNPGWGGKRISVTEGPCNRHPRKFGTCDRPSTSEYNAGTAIKLRTNDHDLDLNGELSWGGAVSGSLVLKLRECE